MKFLNETIHELYREKRDLDRIIAVLEEVAAMRQASVPALQPRGRKFMGEEERRRVSERMKVYWAQRHGKDQSTDGIMPHKPKRA